MTTHQIITGHFGLRVEEFSSQISLSWPQSIKNIKIDGKRPVNYQIPIQTAVIVVEIVVVVEVLLKKLMGKFSLPKKTNHDHDFNVLLRKFLERYKKKLKNILNFEKSTTTVPLKQDFKKYI